MFYKIIFYLSFEQIYYLQILISSTLGFIIQAVLLILFIHSTLAPNLWTWEVAIVFSIICCIIDTDIVSQELNKTQGKWLFVTITFGDLINIKFQLLFPLYIWSNTVSNIAIYSLAMSEIVSLEVGSLLDEQKQEI